MVRRAPSHWIISILAVVFVLTPSLSGHAILLTASPKAKEVISSQDVPVRLRFNARIDAKRSRIILVAGDGSESRIAVENQTSPDMLGGQLRGLKPGFYLIRWQVLAIDGHITRGELPFQVH